MTEVVRGYHVPACGTMGFLERLAQGTRSVLAHIAADSAMKPLRAHGHMRKPFP